MLSASPIKSLSKKKEDGGFEYKKHNATASSGAVSFVPVRFPKSLTVNELRRPDRPKSLIYKDLRKKS